MIYSIPSEVTEYVLTFCSPRDVASFAQTCHLTRSLIYRSPDQHLWRQLFLAVPFDDLRLASIPAFSAGSHIDWKSELQDRIRAESILQFKDVPPQNAEFTTEEAMNVVLRAIHLALPAGQNDSHNITWAQHVLSNCPLFAEQISDIPGASESQARAQLLAYEGLFDFEPLEQPVEVANKIRTQSRCYVYDLTRYKLSTNYSVFQSIGITNGQHIYEVNWVHVLHCINVVVMNIWDLVLGPNLPPRGLAATRAYSAPGEADRAPHDWAGIEGIWRRYVCFMDYRDLYSFNFSESNRCDPAFFEDDQFHEATRLIELELHIVAPDKVPIPSDPASYSVDLKYPRLHFAGSSRGLSGHRALIKGYVDRYWDGTIRWTFLSVYDHQTQWLFNGVQLGNACSEAGVVGTWTGTAHEPDDPSGPSWIWKIGSKNRLHASEQL